MTTTTTQPATAKQTAFIRTLLAERQGVEAAEILRAHANWLRQEGRLNKRTASELIAALLEVPKPARSTTREPYPDVPEGHYAVASATGNNDLDFYRVDRPSKGQWAGYTFVKRVVGGSPDQRVRGAEARGALERILIAGIAEARALYGQELGQCARCNRHLTDDESRRTGIGPECRKHEGWAA